MHNRNRNYSLYQPMVVDSLRALLYRCSELYPDKPAFIHEPKRNEMLSVTYAQFLNDVENLGTWLLTRGYKHQKIAILGENSYLWLASHFAVTCSGNIAVPMDKELSPMEIKRVLIHSETALLIYSPSYSEEAEAASTDILCISMKDLDKYMREGRTLIDNGERSFADCDVSADSPATIVYTSGTTGLSKGVMLSHRNIAADTVATCENIHGKTASMLILPLHHTFGFIAGVTCNMLYGISVYINKSLKNLNATFQKARPDQFAAVPMILEGLYRRIWENAKEQGNARKLRFLLVISRVLFTVGIDIRRRLFRPIIDSFGGELIYIISGGAPLSENCIRGFEGFGIEILNGYGITECAPVVATNRNDSVCCGSVGFPVSCNEVRINQPNDLGDGEIWIRGKNVTLGYWKNQEANDMAFINGWFKTGDLGHMDRQGHLFITGRLKNTIILGNGENVQPEEIEERIAIINGVKEVLVFAENNTIVAEVFPEQLTDDSSDRIKTAVFALNRTQPAYKRIAEVRFRSTPFDKTTSKKIIRGQCGTSNLRKSRLT